jgi:hypothetical protein
MRMRAGSTFLFFALLLAACAGERHALRLGQVSGGLQSFEGSTYDGLAEDPVYYTEIGEPDYDKFFQEAAAVNGSMHFALRVAARLDDIVAGRAKATPQDVAVLYMLVLDTLPRTQKRAVYLYTESQRLRDRVGSDFFWRFYKIGKVRGAVNEARANLEAAKKAVPELMKRLEAVKDRINLNKLLEKSL